MSDLANRLDQLSPLQRAIFALQKTKARLEQLERAQNEPLALIGMACRFPGGVVDTASYWRLLCDGVDAVGEIPPERWDVEGYFDPDPQAPGKMNSRHGGFLTDVDLFDNHFFGISDDEARLLDPQQRLLLEVTWEALEDAGIPPTSLQGTRTGVFLGISNSEYSLLSSRNPHQMVTHFSTGTALSIAANRISHVLDLRGPSMAVDTACSSSLVALHLATQALRHGDCDTAIVAGASLIFSPAGTIILTKTGMSAPDGRIRAFDQGAEGYVRSEGVGVLVLKRASTAQASGDQPYALVRGTAVSQTGRANGLSAPVGAIQEQTLRDACEQAGIPPGKLAYVETQGTGTLIGDAIEAKALGTVLSDGRDAGTTCAIGSVKTNLGHLEAASGIASLMKVALSLKHGELPPSLHFASPNPMIPFAKLPLRVPTRRESLPVTEGPTLASVNGFGYGGSTVHVVMESAPEEAAPREDHAAPRLHAPGELPGQEPDAGESDAGTPDMSPTTVLLTVSARTDAALRDLAAAYRDFLRAEGGRAPWRDVCATALHRRDHHDCRMAVAAESAGAAADQIDRYLSAIADGTSVDEQACPVWASRRPFERHDAKAAVRAALAALEASGDEPAAVAQLYLAGGERELQERAAVDYTPVRLPHYAWQRQRAWTDEPNPFARAETGLSVAGTSEIVSSATAPLFRGANHIGPGTRPDLNTPFTRPKTELQSRVAAAWSRVLHVDSVGIHDNFFELGGQSLQAAMLIHEVQQLTGVQLDLIALFELQTVADLTTYLEAQYGEAVTRGLQQSSSAVPATSPKSPAQGAAIIPRVSRDAPLPLSFGQQRFWFLDQLSPGAAIYNTHMQVPLHGPLDRALLQKALSQTVARHESLRTVICTHENQARQQILEPRAVDLPLTDLSQLQAAEQAREVRRLSHGQASTGFRLGDYPLFRLGLLQLNEQHHVLLLTVHHIVVDGVSLAILLRDMMEFYAAGVEARTPRLPALPLQYADFAAWQRDSLPDAARDDALAFWRERLAGIQPLHLHTDRPRSAKRPPHPGTHKFTIEPELFRRLQGVCRQHHVTPFLLTLTALKILLARYSGQDDIVVGTPIAGRSRSEFADVVGFFVNTLTVRTDLAGDPAATELLARVRATYLESVVHQDLPFDELAKVIEPDREANRHPVFQVLFNYLQQVRSPQPADPAGLAIGQIPTEQPPHGGEFDLALVLIETDDALDANLGFNAALFDQATIERVGRHFVQLLEQLEVALSSEVQDTPTPLSRLSIVTPEEQRDLDAWEGGPIDVEGLQCVHRLFEQQAAGREREIAVVCEGEKLTYAELNVAANQLAHHLRALGVGPSDYVGVFLDRTVQLPAAILAVLKAGGCVVPLEPDYPSQRLAMVLQDCQPVVVITETGLAERLDFSGQRVLIDRDQDVLQTARCDNPDVGADLGDAAYVIYTSGSTGQPKGAINHHLGLANVIVQDANLFGLRPDDRYLCRCPVGFDVFFQEFFRPLSIGGRLVLAGSDECRDARALVRRMRDERVTIMFCVPSILEALLDEQEIGTCDSLRRVFTAGEVLTPEAVQKHRERLGVPLTNCYGPAETAIWTTSWDCGRQELGVSVPIGRPLANTRAYILDERQQRVPPGVEGEIYVGGVAVGNGYINNASQTATKFLPDPFGAANQTALPIPAMMYRTGDRGRWLPDGNIEFRGRSDQQVKIRGVRIETGEVESVLKQHPAIRAAVVDVRRAAAGEKRLVAYLLSETRDAEVVAQLRELARRHFVGPMRPTDYMFVDAIPISPNGKTNRAALPDPSAGPRDDHTDIAPRTETERRLARIWQDVLRNERVGVEDSFFELGGHSLLATQMIARVNDEFQVDLRLRVLFELPTIAELARIVDEAARLAGPSVPLECVDRSAEIPLMLPQESQWLVDEMSDGPSAYSMNSALKLTGPLDVAALEAAINEVLRRHESLRTTFPAIAGRPVQRIHPFQAQALETTDVSHVANPEAYVAARLEALNAREIDLQHGPILAWELLRFDVEIHVLLIAGHHILFDAWSADVLLREIFLAYTAFRQGLRSPLGELPYQCADVAAWQREQARSDETLGRLDYWREQLRGVPRLELPTFPRRTAGGAAPNADALCGAVQRQSLPAELGPAVQAFCRQREATPFMVMMAAFQVVLARLSGQRDFAVGTPVAGRMRRESQDLIGCFVNPLVHRCRLDGEPTFDELLDRVRATTLEAFDHEVPFETLVEGLNPSRENGGHPFFQVLFVYRQFPGRDATHAAGLALTELAGADRVVPKFDLTLFVNEQDGQLQLDIEYDERLFMPASIDRLADQFQAVLANALADPDRRVSGLPMLSQADRHTLLVDWAGRDERPDDLLPVQHQVEQQAARSPQAMAVVCCGETLTYGELNDRANQLARLLRNLGVGPESRVGIQLPRSTQLVVSVLAVLKAGGACVPFDPDYPAERLAFMREDSEPAVLLTRRDQVDNAAAVAEVVCVDDDARIDAQSRDNLAPVNSLDDACYVMYTSGSTGKPKAAIVPHRSLANLMAWDLQTFEFSPADCCLVRAPIGFDMFIQEYFRPLLAGGRMILAGDHQYQDPAELVALFRQEQVTVAFMVPALWNVMLDEPDAPQCTSLRHVSVAGEALTRALMQKHFETLKVPLHNLYGPVEANVVSAWHCNHDYEYTCVPIGKPIANVRLYILDPAGGPTPVGVAGELFIGGSALAREYLGRPELTAARFLPDPFSDDETARMYRTGDRCRWLPDGNIEFLGRLDTQVKIRGVRIELEEVESLLKAHPEIRDAVVDVRQNARGEAALVAYLVSDVAMEKVRPQLEATVKDHLVAAMRPESYVAVETIPVSSHGKIDRAALPDPAQTEPNVADFVAPITETQRQLAEIWKSLLQLDRVSIHDSFFDVGGHSLLAARVASQATATFDTTVRMRMVFEEPTIAGLARRIDRAGKHAAADAPPIEPLRDRDRDFPLSSVQESMWLIHELSSGTAPYGVGGAIRLRGDLDRAVLAQAIDAVIQRHESLRTCYVQQDGRPRQRVLALDPLPLPVADLTALEPEQREDAAREIARREMTRTIDLTGESIIQTRLLALDGQTHWLIVSGHHIAFDAWSLEILEREIGLAYLALSTGNRPSFARLPVQYADYAVWQRKRLQSDFGDTLLSYWRKQLADVPPLQWPAKPPTTVITQRNGDCQISLSPAVASEVRRLCREHDATPFMVLHSVYQIVLARYTGQTDFAIGTPLACRVRPEVSELIGCFINPVAIRCDLSGQATFAALLDRVKQTTLAAFDHQEMPLGELVQKLNPARDHGRHPFFQVGFNYLHRQLQATTLGGLTAEPVELGEVEPKFELMLAASEVGDDLRIALTFDALRFDEATVRELLEQFTQILAAGLANPEKPLSSWLDPSLSSAEVPATLAAPPAPPRSSGPTTQSGQTTPSVAAARGTPATTSRVKVDLTQLRCVHETFEAWVVESPAAIAVVCDGQQLTYDALNDRANQLAAQLRQAGVQPGDLVGIHLPPCLELPIAILGVFKAGAAIVLLDVDQPRQRLALILEDCQPNVVLSNRDLSVNLNNESARVICLDAPALPEPPGPSSNLAIPVKLDDAAYVVYTSGSTGTPKGAVNHHLGLANLLENESRIYNFAPDDRFLVRAPIGFDVFLNELVRALVCGGRMVLATQEQHKDAAALVKLVDDEGVTFAQIVPAVLKAFLTEVGPGQGTSLRTVLAGGDTLTPDVVALCRERLQVDFYNRYGPAEASISVTTWRYVDEYVHDCLPIGSPYDHVEVYVLDEQQKPVDDGEPGELCIGGIAVGRGYLNRPELTAVAFLPDPFAAHDSNTPDRKLMYRTGDMCRRLPDGNLQFLGRRDLQVKVRGVRIELGEIEAALKQHPDIVDAVVDVRAIADEPQLIGYLVPQTGAQPDLEQLPAFVEACLPASMRPAAYIVIDAVPLSHHGKVDRQALRDPQAEELVGRRTFVAPRTSTEQAIATIWRNVLQLEEIGIDDDFFDLGGHSLRVTQVVSRLNNEFAITLRPRAIFEHPTVATLAEEIEHHQRGSLIPPIPIEADRSRDFPLSFTQETLWLMAQTARGASPYVMRGAIRFKGSLELQALLASIEFLRRRHEAIRTSFPEVNGVPVQRIEPYDPAPLEVIDLTHLAEVQREPHLQRLLADEDAREIDLRRGGIVRLRLFRVSAQEHLLLVMGHHIIFDGWSSELLPREIAAAYMEYRAGRQPRLPAVAAQPGDFALWQRARLSGSHVAKLETYWQEKLAGVRPLEMPSLSPENSSDHLGGRVTRFLPADLSHALHTFCREQELTPYMVTLAAMQVVLARYCEQNDFAIGTPTAGRLRPELEGAIGCFINLLPMRCDLTGDPSFAALLQRTRNTALEAFEHQELPYVRIVELLSSGADRIASLFQSTFQYRHVGARPGRLGELEIVPEEGPARAARYQLDVTLMDRVGELEMRINYDAQRFDDAAIERLVDQYLHVLRAGIAEPATKVKHLSLLSRQERQQVLVEWNATEADLGGLRCVHQTFEELARRTPDACAVVCDGETLTYGELNARANQLAHHLQGMGVGCEDLVAVLLDRSVNVPVAAMAVWKTGAVLVPLDPDYPQPRLALVLENCRPRVLITNELFAVAWADTHNCVVLPRDAAEIAQQPRQNPAVAVGLRNAAYVIFTSGSTGVPKGTVNEHLGLANLMSYDVKANQLVAEDRYISRCALGFDVFIQELLRPLVTGGALVLAGSEEYRDPAALVRLIHEQRVTVADFVPAILKALLEEPDCEKCDSLRHVFSGGDVLTPEIARMFHAKLNAELFNVYGPAETAIWITAYSCDRAKTPLSIPIGSPITNCRIYILDEHATPAPIGVEGELYIGGVPVGRGYLHHPALTAEKFLPDPFATEPGATMYRTGDRARWLPDGNIEFHGRRDHQVKIRGVRIEMGEVESVIRRHPGIRDAAADVRKLPDGEPAIAAYVVAEPDEAPSTDALRQHVQHHLPPAMHPASYTLVAQLPLSPNGKIERRSLPDPQWARSAPTPVDKSTAAVTTASMTDTERRLAEIWCGVLGRDSVGVHDNFFEMGGHSLVAVKVMTKIRGELSADLPLAKMFTSPTIAQLACELDRVRPRTVDAATGTESQTADAARSSEALTSPLVHVGVGTGPRLFLVHGMGGYATNLIPLGRELRDSYDVFALEAQGPFDDRPPHDSIPEMATYYLEAVRQQQPEGPYLLAGWSMGGTVAWEMCRQLIAAGETVERLVLVDAYPLWGLSLDTRSEFIANRMLPSLGPAFEDIELLPARKRWQAIMERAETFTGPGADAISRLVRTCVAHQAASASYVAGKLDVDVIAFWARQQWGRRLVSQWRKRARRYVARTVSGDHYSMLESPHVEKLATDLQNQLQTDPLTGRKAG